MGAAKIEAYTKALIKGAASAQNIDIKNYKTKIVIFYPYGAEGCYGSYAVTAAEYKRYFEVIDDELWPMLERIAKLTVSGQAI